MEYSLFFLIRDKIKDDISSCLLYTSWNELAAEVPEGSARSVALQLLPECRKVFAGYTLSDDFMSVSYTHLDVYKRQIIFKSFL